MKRLVFIILAVLLAGILAGCKTGKTLTNTVTEYRTEYRDRYHKDSIIIRDSVFVFVKGDTVFKDRWKTVFKDRIKNDTVFQCDTVFVDKEIIVEKREGPSGWSLVIAFVAFMIAFKLK